MTEPKRKHIPMKAKVEACLLLLGFKREDLGRVQWDHFPALKLRPIVGDDYDPPSNDPAHLRPMLAEDHLAKTSGRKGESRLSITPDGDAQRINKVKRLRKQIEEENVELRQDRLHVNPSPPTKWPKPSAWPKGRKIESRGFAKGSRKLRAGPRSGGGTE